MRWAKHVERMRKTRGTYWVSMVKCEEMRLLERPSRRMEETTKVYLREIGWKFVDGLIWLMTGTGGGLL